MIENFFGFPDGIGGAELARLAGRQAEKFGAELLFLNGVTRAAGSRATTSPSADPRRRSEVTASVVLAAPGMDWRRLELDGIDELLGHGVYYGAGRSEAAQCAGPERRRRRRRQLRRPGGAQLRERDGARDDARARRPARQDDVGVPDRADRAAPADRRPPRDAADRAARGRRKARRRDVRGRRRQGRDARGRRRLPLHRRPAAHRLVPARARAHRRRRLHPDGARTCSSTARGPTGWPLDRDPLPLETSRVGLFAAGDVRHGSTKRVAAAVGEGSMAAALVFSRLGELGVTV
jgi:thioredoxin reductase (NADPH)